MLIQFLVELGARRPARPPSNPGSDAISPTDLVVGDLRMIFDAARPARMVALMTDGGCQPIGCGGLSGPMGRCAMRDDIADPSVSCSLVRDRGPFVCIRRATASHSR